MSSSTKIRNQQPWYNALSQGVPSLTEENYYDPASLPWTPIVERHWSVIRKEILDYIKRNEDELKSFYAGQQRWKSFAFYAWGLRISKEKCRACPETIRLLRNIPGIVTIMVGVMEPHSEINGHHGDTDAIYRCHLPLMSKGTLPELGMEVGGEQKAWEEGRCLVFNDARYHRTWNHTDNRRVVLILDVLKPEYVRKSKTVCSIVLSALTVQKIQQMHVLFRKIPGQMYYPLFQLFRPLIRVCLQIQPSSFALFR